MTAPRLAEGYQYAISRTMGGQPIDWKKPLAPQRIVTRTSTVLGLALSGTATSTTTKTARFITTEPSTPRLAIARAPKRSASCPFTNCPTAYISVSAEKTMPMDAASQEKVSHSRVLAMGMLRRHR